MPIRVLGPTDDRHPRRPWDSPERRKERQQQYMDKHGERPPRRKRLTPDPSPKHRKNLREKLKDLPKWKVKPKAVPAKKYAGGGSIGKTKGPKGIGKPKGDLRDILKKARPKNWHDFSRRLGGGEKGKPHSSKEGQKAAGRRRFKRIVQRDHPVPNPKRTPGEQAPRDPRSPYIKDRVMTPLRAKHGLGSLVKKGISKILKPKPKGVAVKPVPKSVTDKPTGWSPKGSYTEADDKKITSILKKLGDEIKAAPLPPKLKATLKKAQKASPHKKASGGRIGLKKGSVHKPGSHSWYLQHMNKNKKASGGRANFRHGGSVGAAIRGHGAEIK